MRLFPRVALIALLAFAGLYAGDYLSARYGIPGNRQTLGSVQVQTLYETRQKNGRVESWVGDIDSETCVRSLFPQLGYRPCWYLSRHPRQTIEISRSSGSTLRRLAQCLDPASSLRYSDRRTMPGVLVAALFAATLPNAAVPCMLVAMRRPSEPPGLLPGRGGWDCRG